MSDQEEFDFDPEEVKDGYEVPPPSHRDGPDTEKLAADRLKPQAKKLRAGVRDFAYQRGPQGITGWEAVEHLGMEEHETSVRPRLTELCEEKHGRILTRTKDRRPNRNHGNSEMVYVATRFLEKQGPQLPPNGPGEVPEYPDDLPF